MPVGEGRVTPDAARESPRSSDREPWPKTRCIVMTTPGLVNSNLHVLHSGAQTRSLLAQNCSLGFVILKSIVGGDLKQLYRWTGKINWSQGQPARYRLVPAASSNLGLATMPQSFGPGAAWTGSSLVTLSWKEFIFSQIFILRIRSVIKLLPEPLATWPRWAPPLASFC